MDAYHESLYVSYQNSGKYTTAQLRELELGLNQNLQVEFYANPTLLPEQMAQIRIGLEHGIDVTSYSDSYWYHSLQMAEIRLGLEAGIDISYYDDVSYSAELMRIIRMGLEAGLDVAWYANPIYNISQASLIYEGLRQRLDVRFYANPSYESEQMLVIKKGLERNLDVRLYADSRFSFMQMTQIRQGLELNIDVQLYAKLDYDEKQMWQIKAGLTEGLDISCYANPAFSANQMQEIRLGLKSGIDISLYGDPAFTYEEMRQIRTIFTRHRKTLKTGKQPQFQSVIRAETIERIPEKHDDLVNLHNTQFERKSASKESFSMQVSNIIPEEIKPQRIMESTHSVTEKTSLNDNAAKKPLGEKTSTAVLDFHSNESLPQKDEFLPESEIHSSKTDILLSAPPKQVMQAPHPLSIEEANSPIRNHSSAKRDVDKQIPVSSEHDTYSQDNKYIESKIIASKHTPIPTEKPAIKPPAAASEAVEKNSKPSHQPDHRPAGAPQEMKKRHNVFYNMTKAANAGRPAISPRELFGTHNQTEAHS